MLSEGGMLHLDECDDLAVAAHHITTRQLCSTSIPDRYSHTIEPKVHESRGRRKKGRPN